MAPTIEDICTDHGEEIRHVINRESAKQLDRFSWTGSGSVTTWYGNMGKTDAYSAKGFTKRSVFRKLARRRKYMLRPAAIRQVVADQT